MNEPLPDSDDQLSLKKRARRRLIGAIVFVTVAAVILPMVMDEEAPPATPNIELSIPAQEKGFSAPVTGGNKASLGVAEPVPAPAATVAQAPAVSMGDSKAQASGTIVLPEKATEPTKSVSENNVVAAASTTVSPAAKAAEAKSPAKPVVKAPAKPESKSVKPEAKPEAKPAVDAKRAQALLEGKSAEAAAGTDGPHVVLIGAFANSGNVQILQKKIGELGYKVYTEPLDSPQGKKTRVRAGPFANREAAEKAVARLKSIGVIGVVAPKS